MPRPATLSGRGRPRIMRGPIRPTSTGAESATGSPRPRRRVHGEVAEWSNAPDSKSGLRFRRNVGSNPTLSASCAHAGYACLTVQASSVLFPTVDPIPMPCPLREVDRAPTIARMQRCAPPRRRRPQAAGPGSYISGTRLRQTHTKPQCVSRATPQIAQSALLDGRVAEKNPLYAVVNPSRAATGVKP